MKFPVLICVVSLMSAVLTVGCGHIEIKPEGNPDRVVTGTVNFRVPTALPADAVVTVRLLSVSTGGAPSDPMGVGTSATTIAGGPPDVLGEQTIKNPGNPPIPFKIEYRAEDALLRLGLNLEARVSVGGKLRFYSVNSYAVTFSNATDPHEIWVDPTGRD